MPASNLIGIIVLEALKELKNPAQTEAIVSKVSSLLECPEDLVRDLVSSAISGGVLHGYIQRNRDKFAYFPIKLSEMVSEHNLDGRYGKSKLDNRINKSKTTHAWRLNVKSSKSTCTMTGLNRKHKNDVHSVRSEVFGKADQSTPKFSALKSIKQKPRLKQPLTVHWRV